MKTQNILIKCDEKLKMARILLWGATNAYTIQRNFISDKCVCNILAYFQSIRFNFPSHLIQLVPDCHALVELDNNARMILKEKFTIHKFHLNVS
jgi:hypothetical protein